MMRLRGKVVILAMMTGAAVAISGVQVDSLGAMTAVGFALVVMGWIQADQDHNARRTTH